MLSKKELEENYRSMSDSRIELLAENVNDLSADALHVLQYEIKRRNLDVSVERKAVVEEKKGVTVFSSASSSDLDEPDLFADAEKVIYIRKSGLRWRGWFLISLSVLMLGLFMIVNQKIFIGLGIVFLLLGIYFVYESKSGTRAQLVFYKEYLLCMRDSGAATNRYSDFYKLFLNQKFIKIPVSEILEVNTTFGFSSISPIVLKLKSHNASFHLLLSVNRKEVAQIRETFKEIYDV